MRLTKLKLAGFKSFVDPTTILLPGQLVAVVGPNGCGKSNIMDAVRWVLGESKATELRGESMQDVIFNGSGNRKPVSRASVELVFDNALGRAAGQWSAYPEIAVKRVLDRDNNSSYHINNLQVRRRDVIDLFLGTGLGPRAYAIIGQGMISRIIEARPEDLRLFLEEAAGVSKYKERRKETQHRLEDARENLARVDDIRLELDNQIGRLEVQAEVARRYKALQDGLSQSQNLLWFSKRNSARSERDRLSKEAELTSLALEGETARLRAIEARVEEGRSGHYAASDAMHGAQAELYAANADVARLEGELNHQKDARRRTESRLSQLAEEDRRWREQRGRADEDEARWQEQAEDAALRMEQAEARHEEFRERLPVAEQAWQTAESLALGLARDLSQVEQQLRVEETQCSNARRALEALLQRKNRLAQNVAGLVAPDTAMLQELRETQAEFQLQHEGLRDRQADLQAALPHALAVQKSTLERERAALKALTETRARRDALAALQQKVQQGGSTGDWLKKRGLAECLPLWRSLQVDAGWETALEAVLRERLSALAVDEAMARAILAEPTQAVLAFGLVGTGTPEDVAPDALLARVRCQDPAWQPLLAAWLAGVRCSEDLAALVPERGGFAEGELWVNRSGQSLSRHALCLYAPDARTHGVLERQEEIDALGARLADLEQELVEAREVLHRAEAEVGVCQEHLAQVRRDTQDLQQKLHGNQLEVLRLAEAEQRFEEKKARADQDREDLAETEMVEGERLEQAEMASEQLRERSEALRARLDAAREAQRRADLALREGRSAEQAAAREVQEAGFAGRECVAKLEDIARARVLSAEQLERIAAEMESRREELLGLDEAGLQSGLQAALEMRLAREKNLAALRIAVDEAAEALRQLEQERLRTEQGLSPQRERINELRLKEQAAQLNEEQYAERLIENAADEAVLEALAMGGDIKESRLNGEINRANAAIADLGAVNLAALDELATARERKGFLDAQYEDLNQAISTLDDAIRRIDRETRDQLQATYDAVNRYFGILFPQLFGGGEARLVLTGDEILDAGIQVMAQPPGKKNSTIHLLSGGEKALTAIALVFSIFQLNPAPFCILDEVDAPLDDSNTERFCEMVKRMSQETQFLYISHNKITMEMANQLVGVTMQESGVSRVVEVDIEEALKLREEAAA